MNLIMLNLLELPSQTLALAGISLVLCPMLCGIMAYQVSRTYASRNAA